MQSCKAVRGDFGPAAQRSKMESTVMLRRATVSASIGISPTTKKAPVPRSRSEYSNKNGRNGE
jgi:hypothetical protein